LKKLLLKLEQEVEVEQPVEQHRTYLGELELLPVQLQGPQQEALVIWIG
jgi:hypothetical protein